jgi:DtxR family Mn-dependent transcriptional regulator
VRNHDVADEVLEAMWVREHERASQFDMLAERLGPKLETILLNLAAQGKVKKIGEEYLLNEEGEKIAVQLVRRHRLAERLFYDLLGFSEADAHRVGCGFEHFLEDDVTDAVCAFLGHPPVCPHDNPIPGGKCCRHRNARLTPLIQPLHEIEVGRKGRVMFLRSDDHQLTDRLFSLGIYPGQVLHLHQKLPSYLVQVDQTEVGLEEAVARTVFVRATD